VLHAHVHEVGAFKAAPLDVKCAFVTMPVHDACPALQVESVDALK
jgi:hypothetical protein